MWTERERRVGRERGRLAEGRQGARERERLTLADREIDRDIESQRERQGETERETERERRQS